MLASACDPGRTDVRVAVEPPTAEVAPNAVRRFEADVAGTFDGRVNWSIVQGAGSIDAAGVFTAPARVPRDRDNDIVVRATSAVDPTKFADARVHIVTWPFSPRRGPTEGGTRLTLSGEGFVPGTEVLFGGVPGTDLEVESSLLLRVTTPPRATIEAVDIEVRIPGKDSQVFPRGFHYAATQLRLGGGALYQACNYSKDVLSFDVNRDGAKDLLVSCYYDSKIAVLLADGSGGLRRPTFLPTTASYASQLLTGDFDGDADLDLFIFGSYRTQVFRHEADGTLVPVAEHVYGGGIYGWDSTAVVADLTGDSMADLAYTAPNTDQVAVVRNNGAGGFLATTLLAVGNEYPYGLAAAALQHDGDADIDLVATYYSTTAPVGPMGGVATFRNNGDGTFAAPTYTQLKPSIQTVALSDMNEDGNVDIIAGSSEYDGLDLTLKLGGPAGFGGVMSTIADGGYEIRNALRVVDADVDGNLDVVTSYGYYSNAVRVFWGNGTGLDPAIRYDLTQYAYDTTAVMIDFDGQGALDLVNPGYDLLEIQTGQPNRAFGAPKVTIGTNPEYLDVRLNQQPDLLVPVNRGSVQGAAIQVLASGDILNGAGVLGTFDLPANTSASRVRSADLDKDGFADAVVTDPGNYNSNDGSVWLFPGLPDGTFAAPLRELFDTRVTDARVADLDADGKMDLVVATSDPATQLGDIRVRWGEGDIAFEFSEDFVVPGGALPWRLVLADLDDDGREEIIATDNVAGRVAIVKTGEGRTIMEPIFVAVGDQPTEILVEDVDEDYIPDLVVLARYAQAYLTEVDVVRGLGDLLYDLPERYRFEGDAYDVAYADLDGDEMKDLALTQSYPACVLVMRGHDNGRFREPEYGPVGGYPYGIRIVDFDGDGLQDAVVSDRYGAALRPLANTSR